MDIHVYDDKKTLAQHAADLLVRLAKERVEATGRVTIAFSGGSTPGLMFEALASRTDMPWRQVYISQVDERIAPHGHADRNLTQLEDLLVRRISELPEKNILPLPADMIPSADEIALFEDRLREFTGDPISFDIMHLGLGDDGHTASLVPGDPVLDVMDKDVAVTGTYKGRQRVTLTYPVLNRAGRILWLIAGDDKVEMVARVLQHDRSIPGGRVDNDRMVFLLDRPAGQRVGTT